MNPSDLPIADPPPSADFEAPSVEEMGAQLPQYEIRALVGQGGMGAIYQGYQPQLDRKVAIKVLRSDSALGEEYEEHFRSEARAMARLQHSNIVAVYDFGETESGLHYIVMEYAEGSTLFDLIHDGALDQARVLDIMAQVCSALQYAHERGVVHRDVKPANILVAPDGCVKMADFGLAKLQGAVGGLGDALFGTPEYAAPEVRDPKVEIDHRADIYSAGVLLFEMLVGEAPAPGSNDVPSRHLECDPRFDRIVSQAASFLPGARYQQASELAAEIEKIRANPGGRHLRVGAAAKEARKGRANAIGARSSPAAVPVRKPALRSPSTGRTGGAAALPVRKPVGKTGALDSASPAAPAPVTLAPGARTRAGASGKRPRAALRPIPGGGSSNWLMLLLFVAVVGIVIWAISAFSSREAPAGRGGGESTPAEGGEDPIKEAESSVR